MYNLHTQKAFSPQRTKTQNLFRLFQTVGNAAFEMDLCLFIKIILNICKTFSNYWQTK